MELSDNEQVKIKSSLVLRSVLGTRMRKFGKLGMAPELSMFIALSYLPALFRIHVAIIKWDVSKVKFTI